MHVWLIHGTWARQARWTSETSPLRCALQQGVGETFHVTVFPWTGKNRTFDRSAASQELVEAVEAGGPDASPRVAIAHSHGGNVAVQAALAHPGLFDAVVTLNTPFLTPLPLNRSALLLHWILLVLSLSFVVFLWLPAGFGFLAWSAGLSVVFMTLLLLRVNNAAMLRQYAPLVRYTGRGGPTRLKILCMASADDEAFGWLEAVDTLSNLPRLLLHKTVLLSTLAGLALAHYLGQWQFSSVAMELFYGTLFSVLTGQDGQAAAAQFGDTVLPETARYWSDFIWNNLSTELVAIFLALSVLTYFFAIWTIVALGALIVTYLIRGFAFGDGFGIAALGRAFSTRLKVTPTPMVGGATVELVMVTATTTHGLRHSDIHANPLVHAEIVRWIQDSAGAGRDPVPSG